MPISDEALQNAKNNFIAVSGEATVGQAIAALQAKGGQPWWHLLVKQDDGSWGVSRFTDLYLSLERMATAAEVQLGGRKGLTTATAVDRDSMETKKAQTLALKSPGGFLVVTVDGIPVGILVEKVSRSGLAISSAKLNDLGGKYVNLKDYGSILLSSSKSQASRSKPDAPGGPLKG
jgi:hypothetical protein